MAEAMLDDQTYVTTAEEEDRLPSDCLAWLVERRLEGSSPEQIANELVKAGFERDLAETELQRLNRDPAYAAADRMTQRFNKLKSIFDVKSSLANLAYGSGSVERRSKISEAEFLERYYSANKPVILTGLLASSPARQKWNPRYLAEVCGDATVQIMSGRQSDPRSEINCESHKREIRMADYVEMVEAGGSSNDYYLVANNGFFDRSDVQPLTREIPLLPDYLDHSNPGRKVFLWFGPAGTITPLHHDVMNVMVAQIYGRKRFTLIPPEQTPYVYNNTGVYGEVDCGKPDYSKHPLYRQCKPISFVLTPGDVLFLPVGWWHYVKALDVSIMVSYINFKLPNAFEWSNPDFRW